MSWIYGILLSGGAVLVAISYLQLVMLIATYRRHDDAAEKALRLAVQQHPHDIEASVELARWVENYRSPAEASAAWRQVSVDHPTVLMAYVRLAKIRLALGDKPGAIRAWQQLLVATQSNSSKYAPEWHREAVKQIRELQGQPQRKIGAI